MKPDISKLNHEQLFALWEAVKAAGDLLDMFNCEPRFSDPRADNPRGVMGWNSAGIIVDDMAREFGLLGVAIARRARALPAATERDRKFRLMLLIRDEIGIFECTTEEAERAFNLIDSERDGEAA